MDNDPKAYIETVLNYYRIFITARRREKLPLSSKTILCLKNIGFRIAYFISFLFEIFKRLRTILVY